MMHLNYTMQLEQKALFVKDALTRIGKVTNFVWDGITASPIEWHYRNKVQFPIASDIKGNLFAGFFAPKSHTIVPITSCLVQHAEVEIIVSAVLRIAQNHGFTAYNEKTGKGSLRHCIIRTNNKGEALVMLVCNEKYKDIMRIFSEELAEQCSSVVSVWHNYNRQKTNVILGHTSTHVYGVGQLRETIGTINYDLSPASFFQINTSQISRLYDAVISYCALTGNEIVLDLYCGSGGIGLYLAKKVRQVIGIEENTAAVRDAEKNAGNNGILNARYHAGRTENIIASISEKIDIVILNPPRTGIHQHIPQHIAMINPSRIVYVSCNPVTLSRDCALFEKEGYMLSRSQAFDMFPQTSLIETVALLEKRK